MFQSTWLCLDDWNIPFFRSCKLAGIGRLSTKDSVLFLCDMQEKFRPNIFQFTNIVSNAARLLQASRILGIPTILTEQYPKGLGPTVPELGAEDLKAHAKKTFSMMIEEVEKQMQLLGNPRQIILCGIEAHACIACTTFDLLEKGKEVHIVADAVSSRSQTDRLFALSRLKQSGAFLTTTEGVLLQLVQGANHPNFKEVQKLLATRPLTQASSPSSVPFKEIICYPDFQFLQHVWKSAVIK